MASGSKKTLPLSDKKKVSKVKRKSTKSELGSGISADPGLNFNYLDLSGLDCLVNKPIIKELAEKVAGDADFDQIAEQFRRIIPRIALLKEKFPEYDAEHYINLMRQNSRNPGVMEIEEELFNYLLPVDRRS